MQTETLNIDHHKQLLVLKVVNRYYELKDAAEKLGISKTTLRKYIKIYNITWSYEKQVYYIREKKLIKIDLEEIISLN